jgi:hypothetical protein
MKRIAYVAVLVPLALACVTEPARGQQYNSDSWIAKPHGTVTTILTFGERQSMWMMTFSLLPGWEFTGAVYVYNNDDDPATDDGYSTSFYAKYMFYENEAKTGGGAVKVGTGLGPGYIDGNERLKDAWQSIWTNAPITIPFFDNTLSWDIMPGASVEIKYGEEQTTAWAFTYSTRLAWYPVSPKLALVAEVFGSDGLNSSSKYRAGLRWEPDDRTNIALTYNDNLGGNKLGAGWEIGMMLFSPPFLCLGGCE